MASLGNFFGPLLTGVASGMENHQRSQEDLSYVRQARAQELAGQQLKNQALDLQNQQQQQGMQNAQATNDYYKSALLSTDNTPAEQGRAVAQQAAPNAPQAPQNPAPKSDFKPVGPLSMEQLAALDQKNGLPIGTTYGLMKAESGGNPNAKSPKGAIGLLQVMPSTGAQPGYGLKPFDPKDPEGATGYFAMLFKKAGGDMSKALAYWNAGPGGNPNNPETRGFIPRVQKGAQEFAQAYGLDQSKQQPTPANEIAARESAGVAVPVAQYQGAVSAQNQQIQVLRNAGNKAAEDGRYDLAQQFYGQADKLQGQQVDLQKKALDVQKEANEETVKLANGVQDQNSYNGFMTQVAKNPAMQAAAAGLNLTGDWNADRNKIQTLANRAITLKDQQDMQLKQQEFTLRAQKEQREQQERDAPKIAQQQAVQQDALRRESLTGKGIPFVPSIQATASAGMKPQDIQKAQTFIQKQNFAWDKQHDPAFAGAKKLASLASRTFVDVDNQNVTTGGVLGGIANLLGPGIQSQAQQELVKNTNMMVLAMQDMAKANGGGVSASTAAMAKRYETTKPNLTLGPEAFKNIAHDLFVASTAQMQMGKFIDEFKQSNPDATREAGVAMWRMYEQALGALEVYNPATRRMEPNTAGLPTDESGKPNENYKDFHVFFANGGRF
jgi:soluble lytic murein transglycosylase-like protein